MYFQKILFYSVLSCYLSCIKLAFTTLVSFVVIIYLEKCRNILNKGYSNLWKGSELFSPSWIRQM